MLLTTVPVPEATAAATVCGVIGGSSPACFTNGSNFAWKRPSGVQFQVNNGEISGDRELVNFSKEF